jgi:hypothetical protein
VTAERSSAEEVVTFLRRRLEPYSRTARITVLQQLLAEAEGVSRVAVAARRRHDANRERIRARAQQAFEFICLHVERYGYTPNRGAIGKALGTSCMRTVGELVAILVADGCISVEPTAGHPIRLVGDRSKVA